MAEDEGVQGEQQQQTEGEGDKGQTPKEISELQSKYDKRIADQAGEITSLREQIDQLRAERDGDVVLNAVEDELAKIDDTKEDALDKLKELSRRLGTSLSKTREVAGTNSTHAADARAEALALRLTLDHGGDYETYKAQLVKAKSLSEMQLAADRLALQLEKEGAKGDKSEGRRVVVDEGRGIAVRSSVVDEMNAIDVTTPEGRAEWEKKEADFRRKITAGSR